MKLIQLSEMRESNLLDPKVVQQIQNIASKYELRLVPLLAKHPWTKHGGWYVDALSTKHGWAEEESNSQEYIPIEIRWRGFKKELIKYAHELAASGRVVQIVDPQMKYGTIGTVPDEPETTDLDDADQHIHIHDSVSGVTRPVFVYMMYVSDPKS